MQQNATGRLKTIEDRHREAIENAGLNPADFLFEAQLERARDSGFWGDDADVEFICRLVDWSPSRYELIELLPLYYFADKHIRVMQGMSADRFSYPAVEFSVATEPQQLVTAYASSRRSAVVDPLVSGDAGGDPEISPEVVEHESIVWMHAGLMNTLKVLTTHFARTFVAPAGDLPPFLNLVTGTESPREFLERLFQSRAKLSGPGNHALKDAELLLMASVTFIAGHEVGHIYLGHTGVTKPLSPFVSLGNEMPTRQADEWAADGVGLTSLWDGMGIDHTWIAPLLFLALNSGWAASVADTDEPESMERVYDWVRRLVVLVRNLVINLFRNGFEPRRVEPILRCAPLVAGAVHEWVRLGGLTGKPNPRRGGINFDPFVYQAVKDVCNSLRRSGSA